MNRETQNRGDLVRPYASFSIDKLEQEFERAQAAGDQGCLRALSKELANRTVPRARALRKNVDALLGKAETKRQTVSAAAKPSKARSGRRPTAEQAHAIELFSSGGSLKINAYAGAGKTSTLELIANSTTRRGQYLAFNRDIVKEARTRFPNTVNCATTHGLAFRAMASSFDGQMGKLAGRINANELAELLSLKSWRIDKNHVLQPRGQGFLILDTIRRFAMSADTEPLATHVPRHGSLRAAPEETVEEVNKFAIGAAKHVWARMQNKHDPIPLGHDGYLKLWALASPNIDAEFILMDEAQDTNQVVIDVLRNQSSQMVYVGDKYQQIYEWRGAINAMETLQTENSTYLTTSFRFGAEIAEAASKLLTLLGESLPVKGNPSTSSRIGTTAPPKAILARTNASTISAVIEALDANKRPHLVGGTEELAKMLRGVTKLKANEPSDISEFFGFVNWPQVVEFSRSGEGDHLQMFVNLVEARGERQLLWALSKTVDETKSNLVISTAHKAKGREWSSVRLMEDFAKSGSKKPGGEISPASYDPSELRLLYVALTRAKELIEVPDALLPMIGRIAEKEVSVANAVRTKQTAPSINAPAWRPPSDWKPPAAAETPQQKNEKAELRNTQPEKKSFIKRIFG